MVILTKNGFIIEKWNKKSLKYNQFKLNHKTGFSLLTDWSKDLKIEKGVKLGHLFKILQEMDSSLLMLIEMLTNSNIKPYINTWNKKSKKSDLKEVVVGKAAEVNWNYYNNDEITIYSECYGLDIKSKDRYALEFTPWSELKDLPLKLSNKLHLGEIYWNKLKKPKKKTIGSINKNGKRGKGFSFTSEFELDKTTNKLLNTNITLGEFFDGLTNELCFFSSPDSRDEKCKVIMDRANEVKLALKKDKK